MFAEDAMMFVFTALIFCSCIALGLSNSCPDEEWKRLGSSCFFFSTEALTWNSARNFCHDILGVDAYLVYILSETENEFIRERLNRFEYEHFFHIGANDKIREGNFVWDKPSTTFDYTNWTPGEPNDVFVEDCVEMNPETGKWNDIPCTESQRFVCRIEL